MCQVACFLLRVEGESFHEFQFAQLSSYTVDVELERVFRLFDINGDGKITRLQKLHTLFS